MRVIEGIIEASGDLLGDNARSFLRRVYGTPGSVYRERLLAIGFRDLEHVLDAGCGFGQWTLELAEMNGRVSAVDIQEERLAVLGRIIRALGIGNADVRQGALDRLPYGDDTFDAAFCYGAIFLSPWRETLRELYRVLLKGGRLYVNANGLGWYIHLWKEIPNPAADYDPQLHAAKSFMNTLKYKRRSPLLPGVDVIITPEEMRKELIDIGFEVVGYGPEGSINFDKGKLDIIPFFRKEYGGEVGVYEYLVEK